MTSDMIQNKFVERRKKPLGRPLHKRLELTRDQSFVDGTNDIFDLLSRKNSAHKQAFGETIHFLERSRVMLRNAEETISEQDKQIETLEDLSGIDALTGLLNDKGLSKAMVREIARTNRGYSEGGLVVMFGLENLAKINKENGKSAGKKAIKLVARALQKEIRDTDIAARIHDDEFVLLFTDTSMSKALTRLQDMAMRLNRLTFTHGDKELRVSLSLGLKSYEVGSRPEKIFRDANIDLQRNRQKKD